MFNKITLVGHLGAEPESRTFPDGGSVCNIRMATSENWKDKNTGERKERTEWHRVVLRNRLGEVAQEYLHKGSLIVIEGSIHTRKWQDQNGQDRYQTEIVGSGMKMLGGRDDTAKQAGPAQKQAPQPASPSSGPDYGAEPDFLDGDIPF